MSRWRGSTLVAVSRPPYPYQRHHQYHHRSGSFRHDATNLLPWFGSFDSFHVVVIHPPPRYCPSSSSLFTTSFTTSTITKRFLVTSREKRQQQPQRHQPPAPSSNESSSSSSSSLPASQNSSAVVVAVDPHDADDSKTTSSVSSFQPSLSSSLVSSSFSLSQFLHDASIVDAASTSSLLLDPTIHLAHVPTDSWNQRNYEAATPLWQHVLLPLLAVSGRPLSMATYMQLALGHEEYGYYRRATSVENHTDDDDDFDQDDDDDFDHSKGSTHPHANLILGADFVTAPEVSSVFAESIGIWFAAQQQQQDGVDSSPYFQLVELGPGKGSLMADWLRFVWTLTQTTQHDDDKNNGDNDTTNTNTTTTPCGSRNPVGICRCVHLMETSPVRRKIQRERLEQLQDELQKKNNNDDDDVVVVDGGGGNQRRRRRPRLVFQFMNHHDNQTTTTTTTVPPADSATA